MKTAFSSSIIRSLTNSAQFSVLALCFLAVMLAFGSRAFAESPVLSSTEATTLASKEGTTLSIKFYKHDTGQQITKSAAGSTVDVVVVVRFPKSAVGAPVTVNAAATLKVAGISLPYEVPMANIAVPNRNPVDGGVLVQTGTQKGKIRIPKAAPRGTSISVKATATVNGAASNEVVAKLSVS